MADKNLKQKNSHGKTADKNQKIGLIISVFSAFILFCIFTRGLILGVVGEFFYKIFTGTLGCLSYPLFFFTFILGVVKTRNMTLSVKGSYVTVICFILFFSLQILVKPRQMLTLAVQQFRT